MISSLTREGSSPPAKIRKVEPGSQISKDGASAVDNAAALATSPGAQPTTNARPESKISSPSESKPKLTSSPCTCNCGGCCCHSTSTEPQHCVRCHTNYTLNHTEAARYHTCSATRRNTIAPLSGGTWPLPRSAAGHTCALVPL